MVDIRLAAVVCGVCALAATAAFSGAQAGPGSTSSQQSIQSNGQSRNFSKLSLSGKYQSGSYVRVGSNGHGKGPAWARGGSKPVPAPIAGAGLPLLLAAGGYIWLRRRRSQANP